MGAHCLRSHAECAALGPRLGSEVLSDLGWFCYRILRRRMLALSKNVVVDTRAAMKAAEQPFGFIRGGSFRESHLSQWDRAALPARSLWERSDGVRPGEGAGKNWITVLRLNPLPRLRLDLSRLGTVKTDSPHVGEVTCINSQPLREPAQVCRANRHTLWGGLPTVPRDRPKVSIRSRCPCRKVSR